MGIVSHKILLFVLTGVPSSTCTGRGCALRISGTHHRQRGERRDFRSNWSHAEVDVQLPGVSLPDDQRQEIAEHG